MVKATLAALLVILVVACGGSEPGVTTRPADVAPDFSLPLGDGGTFVLSEEARPVFLVFWAEW